MRTSQDSILAIHVGSLPLEMSSKQSRERFTSRLRSLLCRPLREGRHRDKE